MRVGDCVQVTRKVPLFGRAPIKVGAIGQIREIQDGDKALVWVQARRHTIVLTQDEFTIIEKRKDA